MAFRADLGKASLGKFELGAAFEDAGATLEQSASSALSIVSQVSQFVERPASGSSSLSFSSDVTSNTTGVGSSVLVFVSDATFLRTVPLSIISTLDIVSTESEIAPRYQSASNALDLNQAALGHVPIINVTAANAIVFVQSLGQQFFVSASSTLSFSSEGIRNNSVTDTLVFVTTAVGSRGLLSALTFVHLAHANVIIRRAADSEISFEETLAYWIQFPDLECNYHPFVGSTTDMDAITPPSVTAPTLGNATLTLTYPFSTPTNTLVLRNPEFGDTISLQFSRIQRDTRGGTKVLFSDRKWPKQKVLALDITALSETKAQDFLTFVQQSLGKEIGLLDHENRQWRGLILNPDAMITDGGGICKFNTHVQFEGELV